MRPAGAIEESDRWHRPALASADPEGPAGQPAPAGGIG